MAALWPLSPPLTSPVEGPRVSLRPRAQSLGASGWWRGTWVVLILTLAHLTHLVYLWPEPLWSGRHTHRQTLLCAGPQLMGDAFVLTSSLIASRVTVSEDADTGFISLSGFTVPGVLRTFPCTFFWLCPRPWPQPFLSAVPSVVFMALTLISPFPSHSWKGLFCPTTLSPQWPH